MGIIIESGEFDPTLRRRIAAFIDALFEEPSVGGVGYAAGDGDGVVGAASVPAASAPAPDVAPAAGAAAVPAAPAAADAAAPRRRFGAFRKAAAAPQEEAAVLQDKEIDFARAAPCEGAAAGDLKSWLDQVDEPFSTTLLALIDYKGLSDVEVYKRAHMSRQLFSRIRSDAAYRPAKKTVLALAIAMELSLDETRDLLGRAGFALSRSSKRDLIVEYFVSNSIHDLFAINEALYEFDQPLI